jgi:hypothetical protein
MVVVKEEEGMEEEIHTHRHTHKQRQRMRNWHGRLP